MGKRDLAAAALAVLVLGGPCSGALAQQPLSQGSVANQSGWVFNVAPYVWLPNVNTALSYNLPADLGGRLPTDVSVGPGDYLSDLDFAAAFAADARHGPFSLLTDLFYTRFSASGSQSRIRSVDFFGRSALAISDASQLHVGTTLGTAIWTLAGGYTVLQGKWGNLDVIAGLRLFAVNAKTDYSLGFTITGPRGNGATFGGMGSVSDSPDVWNGIGGVRGRLRFGNTPLFIPYYFDIGAGGSQLTWQIASGLGYQARWGALSVTYRYLSFEQGGNAVVRHMNLGGPMLTASFRF
jgi:hypothetical protein